MVNFAGLKLKNPLFVASGIAGFGEEYSQLFNLNILGGFITKTITLNPRQGNLPPRIMETSYGIINSIGLENPGVDNFIKLHLPFIQNYFKIPVVLSITEETEDKFLLLIKKINRLGGISAIELNLSCPNIASKKLYSQDAKATYKIVHSARKAIKLPIIAKLSPAVTDITEIASACKDAGADAVSLVNSFPVLTFTKPSTLNPESCILSGGLSGPALKPIALRMINEVAKKVKINIMGIGGIYSITDVLDFLNAGAKTVAIGSAIFKDPLLPKKIISAL